MGVKSGPSGGTKPSRPIFRNHGFEGGVAGPLQSVKKVVEKVVEKVRVVEKWGTKFRLLSKVVEKWGGHFSTTLD